MATEPDAPEKPSGFLALRTMAMPGDTNPAGHIFGGWLLSQMDLAGGIHAGIRAKGTVATVAVDAMKFHAPVHVGDEVSCYTTLTREGRTSLTIHIEAWVRRAECRTAFRVTSANFHFVAVGEDYRPKELPKQGADDGLDFVV